MFICIQLIITHLHKHVPVCLVIHPSTCSCVPLTVDIPTQQSEDNWEDNTYSNKGNIESDHYSINLEQGSKEISKSTRTIGKSK